MNIYYTNDLVYIVSVCYRAFGLKKVVDCASSCDCLLTWFNWNTRIIAVQRYIAWVHTMSRVVCERDPTLPPGILNKFELNDSCSQMFFCPPLMKESMQSALACVPGKSRSNMRKGRNIAGPRHRTFLSGFSLLLLPRHITPISELNVLTWCLAIHFDWLGRENKTNLAGNTPKFSNLSTDLYQSIQTVAVKMPLELSTALTWR